MGRDRYRKTYVKGHRIPIDDEHANMLAVLIYNVKMYNRSEMVSEKRYENYGIIKHIN